MTQVSGDLQVLMFSLDPRSAHTAYWVKHCSVRISSSHATNHQTPETFFDHIDIIIGIRLTFLNCIKSVSGIILGVREVWGSYGGAGILKGSLNYSKYRYYNLKKSKIVQSSPYYPWRSGWWARHRWVTWLTWTGCCQFTSKWHHWTLNTALHIGKPRVQSL